MGRLIIHATNIHHGGGAILLIDLLRKIPDGLVTIVSIDSRMVISGELPACVSVERVRPTFLGRLCAEFRLASRARVDDHVLCFGNLPPVFRVKGNISVFIQNRFVVDREQSLRGLPLNLALRLWVERVWLDWFRARSRRYFVQTASMKRLAEECLGGHVVCAPFVPVSVMHPVATSSDSKSLAFDFIYVASGEAHKNHEALIAAWGILADEGLFPSLALTIAPDGAKKLLNDLSAACVSQGLRIYNLGVLHHEQLLAQYRVCGALIYPSSFESFGLPLIEAKLAGLPVLAPELDYVRDIVDPEETFDPNSPVSIARAIKRFMRTQETPFEPESATDFLNKLMGDRTP